MMGDEVRDVGEVRLLRVFATQCLCRHLVSQNASTEQHYQHHIWELTITDQIKTEILKHSM